MSALRYAAAAPLYWDLGWRGVIPVHPADKGGVPKGFTGHDGVDVTQANLDWFIKSKPGYNLGLRLPPDVIGIDVDCWGGKTGAATLAEAEKRWGRLPYSPRSSNRDDGSRIMLYRVPAGIEWPEGISFGELGLGGIEILQRKHRYAQVWPSTHSETGRPYQWYGIDGGPLDHPPGPADLPELPPAWVEALRVPEHSNGADLGGPGDPGDPGGYDVRQALTAGEMSQRVTFKLAQAMAALYSGACRHDQTRDHVLGLLRCGKQGDGGVLPALEALRDVFVAAVASSRAGGDEEAKREFRQFIYGDRAAKLLADPAYDDLSYDTTLTDRKGVPIVDALTEIGADRETPGPPRYVDIAALLAGGLPEPPSPSLLYRTDNVAVFYEGKRNELYGDPGDGKTMLALAAVPGELAAGGRVLFIDLDNNGAVETVQRSLMLGAAADALGDPDRFRYIEPADAAELMAVVADCKGWATFVILDCVGELLLMFNGSSNNADDYTRILRAVSTPLEKGGAGVVLLDHQAKGNDSRQYGAGGTMAKRRAVSGVSINLVGKQAFTPGQGGRAELWINKDRPGGLARHCPAASGRRRFAGTFILDAPGPTGRADWRVTTEHLAVDPVPALDPVVERHATATAAIDAATFTVYELAAVANGLPKGTPPTDAQKETTSRAVEKLVQQGRLEAVAGSSPKRWQVPGEPE